MAVKDQLFGSLRVLCPMLAAAEEHTPFAEGAFRKLIELGPRDPALYYFNGACTLARGTSPADRAAAARAFLKVINMFDRPTFLGDRLVWARAITRLYATLTQPGADQAIRPEWWTDRGLISKSKLVVAAAPDDYDAHMMRAEVLSAGTTVPNVRGGAATWSQNSPRTVKELRLAGEAYMAAARLADKPTTDRLTERMTGTQRRPSKLMEPTLRNQSVRCKQCAAQLEQKMMQSQSASL